MQMTSVLAEAVMFYKNMAGILTYVETKSLNEEYSKL